MQLQAGQEQRQAKAAQRGPDHKGLWCPTSRTGIKHGERWNPWQQTGFPTIACRHTHTHMHARACLDTRGRGRLPGAGHPVCLSQFPRLPVVLTSHGLCAQETASCG